MVVGSSSGASLKRRSVQGEIDQPGFGRRIGAPIWPSAHAGGAGDVHYLPALGNESSVAVPG